MAKTPRRKKSKNFTKMMLSSEFCKLTLAIWGFVAVARLKSAGKGRRKFTVMGNF